MEPAANAEPGEYRPGNREDFDRLYSTTYGRIFRTLAGLLGDVAAAEDCTQEAYLHAYKAWSRWKPEAPAEAWVHRIAINAAIGHRRKQRLREAGELVRRLGHPEHLDPTDRVLDQVVVDEVRRLPPKQAVVLVLRHVHGYSNREIGLTLGVSESTVAGRLAWAKKTLRGRLASHLDSARSPNSSVVLDTSDALRISPVNDHEW